MVNVRKRGNSYQNYFEIAPVDGKRKQKVKSGFKTKAEAYNEGMKAYNEYNNTGTFLKYHTIEAYKILLKSC